MNASLPIRLLVWVAATKVVLAVVLSPWALQLPTNAQDGHAYPPSLHLTLTLVFAVGAVLLVVGGARDERAVVLGAFFFTISAVYAERLLERFLGSPGLMPVPLLQLALWMPVTVFAPFLLWRFIALFPRARTRFPIDRVVRAGTYVAGLVGAAILILHVPLLLERWLASYQAPDLSHLLAPRTLGSHYGTVAVVLVGLAIPCALLRAGVGDIRENRRVRVFVSALAVGLGPFVLVILLEELFPAMTPWIDTPTGTRTMGFIVFIPLLSIPFTTGYAVLVHRVLAVRLIARKALQYSLARYSALLLAVVPLLGLAAYLYLQRSQTLVEIFSGPSALLLFAATGFGLFTFARRRDLLEAVDRRYFREQYDARRILTPLVERIRSTRDHRELADLVTHGIDRALHLESVALLVEEPERGELVDPAGRVEALGTACPLLSLVSSSRQALDVDPETARKTLDSLGAEDLTWLLDGDFRSLMPVYSSDGSLLGIIALGEKKSGLPFLGEDRQLLSAIANAAALALDIQRLTSSRNGSAHSENRLPSAAAAQECFGCGRLYLVHHRRCPGCDRDLEAALVPYVLPGRFRFEKRIGAGGMGVVYRAVDLALGRPVAIKTMRRFSVDDAMRLRREARAAAAVRHPNLAVIYGVESWQGTPMLILEFLDQGNLQERLDEAPLGYRETVELGIALAGALVKLHGANILHRDLKPSNIGFAADGTPKLMDFGIARLRFDLRREAAIMVDGPTAVEGVERGTWSAHSTPETASRQLVGTLHYLSPEAVAGRSPEPGFDLWGLSVVLYECLTGTRIFNGTLREVMRSIGGGAIPDLRSARPDCPAPLAELLGRCLHRQRDQRPADAVELRDQLRETLAQLESA
jgi:hypothetical protein